VSHHQGRLFPVSVRHGVMRKKRARTTFRSICLPGALAAAAVFLALGLLSAVPSRGTAAGPPPTSDTAPEQHQASTAGGAGEPAPPAVCRPGLPPSGQALHRSHATDRGVDPRHAEPGVLLLPGGSTAGIKCTAWLTLRGGLTAASRPPLHVLFCTWLA